MRCVGALSKSMSRLKISSAALEHGKTMLEANNVNEDISKFHKEWLNEAIIVLSRSSGGGFSPNASFLAWLRGRIEDPYRVGIRFHDAVRSEYGDEIALLFSSARWQQEVAWAKRMRASDNDRIVILAETWLLAAKRDSGSLFKLLAKTYADIGISDESYMGSQYHLFSVDEIMDGSGDEKHWRPLWLRFAETEFGRRVNHMPRQQITSVATKIRQDAVGHKNRNVRIKLANHLRRHRPSLMLSVIRSAYQNELSSDDLVCGEADFIKRVESGDVNLVHSRLSAWQIFLADIPRLAGFSAIPDSDELDSRSRVFNDISPEWSNRLPREFFEIGSSQTKITQWVSDISKGERLVPKDPVVDYGLWLLHNKCDGENLVLI